MINKSLIQALNSVWLMEPTAAEKYAAVALDLLQPGAVINPVNGREHDTQNVPYTKNGVYVLPVSGPIMKNENCGTPGTSNMVASLQQAIADPNIEAIVLQIDSPGGTVDGTKIFADAIKQSTKPVVAYVDGLMASAAYWIGSSASSIIASTPIDIIGSIGTMVQWADFTEAYKQRGIKVHEAYASDSVDKNKIFSNATITGNYTEIVTKVLDPINEQFLSAVKDNRSGKIDLNKENVLTGKTYMAKDALKNGLIDKIGTLDQAIKTAKGLASAKAKTKMETNMAFQKTLSAAKAESFEVVENIGFGLTEENLNNVEAHINSQEQIIAELKAELNTAQSELNAANTKLTETNNQIQSLGEQITSLSQEVETLKEAPAAVAPDPAAANDPTLTENGKEKYMTSVDKAVQSRKRA